jgi:hypothetical protein
MVKKGPIQAKSIRSLARQVGRAESTVRKWISRDDWLFALTPPWGIEKIKAWMEIHLNPDPVAAYRKRARAAEAGTQEFSRLGPLGKARLQAAIETALLRRQRRLKEAGDFHDAKECQQRRLAQVYAVKHALLRLPRSLAAELVGKTRGDIEQLLRQHVMAICTSFARGSGHGDSQ